MKERLRTEARALRARSHGWFRRWFRKVWNVRGGGLYASGFAATFIYLEAGSLIDDFREVGLLLDGRIVAFVINFVVDSFRNTIGAFMWPAHIAQFAPPYGAIGLGLAFVFFPMFLKKPIERWLFSDEPETSATAKAQSKD